VDFALTNDNQGSSVTELLLQAWRDRFTREGKPSAFGTIVGPREPLVYDGLLQMSYPHLIHQLALSHRRGLLRARRDL
jgi:hypothetical protein